MGTGLMGNPFPRSKDSRKSRGYGYAHTKERNRLVDLIKTGKPVLCHFCNQAITITDGRHKWGLHLDHTLDRTGYRGPAHNHCNVVDGAARGRARQRGDSTTTARWAL